MRYFPSCISLPVFSLSLSRFVLLCASVSLRQNFFCILRMTRNDSENRDVVVLYSMRKPFPVKETR